MGNRWLYCLILVNLICIDICGQTRLESEYKLSVATDDIEYLQSYLTDEFKEGTYQVDGIALTIERADELFFDSYFDDDDNGLLAQEVGVRHRLRYNHAVLTNELIQIKLPSSTDGVVREEIKYKVPKKINAVDKISRHPVLQFVDAADRDHFSYQLRQLGVDANKLKQSIRLSQRRARMYFLDKKGSVATISLDHVKNKKIPFQEFYELEIEINELRYTEADPADAAYLETINRHLKQKIVSRFPNLIVDQTPKYNKLHAVIEASPMSKLVDKGMWGIYGLVIVLAGFKLVNL